jgi:Asp-tRNA(Asn)/Glu-tRNA(Gln) amidotransferase A subunit family amidase
VELRDALIGYADWLGHGHGERAAAWLARLELNRPELEAFRAAPTPFHPAYLPCATEIGSANGVSAGQAALPADAADALARARRKPELNAFTFLPERLEESVAGLLAGVPVAVKDLMLVKGMPLTSGSKAMDAVTATRDAEVVARLRRAGAVVVGLTNLHEFAYGITSDNPRFGRVVNPAAPSRIPGGSSGGSAAAVAAGIVRLAVGTDTAGSIRIPAACCGIVGFKPSYDALPREGVVDLAHSLDHVGPMGLAVDDCAVMFAAMLGLAAVPKWTRADLAGITIARLGGYFDAPLDGEVRGALDAAMTALAADGSRNVERTIEGVELAPAIQLNTIAAEATAFHADRLRARGADYGEDVRVRIEMGLFLPGAWYVKAQRLRTQLVDAIERAFGDADAFICPAMRALAPPVGASRADIGGKSFALHTAVTSLTLPFNLAGLPAISVPWSRSKEGVPISLQVVGKRGDDWRTLAIARRLEAASPCKRQRASS